MNPTLLKIHNLTTAFQSSHGWLKAITKLNLNINRGEILGLVGESGCGKSITALSILGLVPPPGHIIEGEIFFKGEDLTKLSSRRLRKIRGAEISLIFQEAMTSLNPVLTIGYQVSEQILAHRQFKKKEAWKMAINMLTQVGIPEADKRVYDYPHQLSGGLRQRVIIAQALILNPCLVIADEITTALDVTIQAQILKLIKNLRKQTNISILLITHNLAVVAQIADRIAIMYTGRLLEISPTYELFANPMHPYTKGLLACLPIHAPKLATPLPTIPGTVPPLNELPSIGCPFSNRCIFCSTLCEKKEPFLTEITKQHYVRCFLYSK